MGLFDWLSPAKRSEARARRHELRGELQAAVEAYLGAQLPLEAARVLLARADSEADPARRMALCGQAAQLAGATDVGRAAARRRALMRFDLVRGPSGVLLAEELRLVAAELEQVGEWDKAAEAYALLGDEAGELGVLQAAGAIDRLENRLDEQAARERQARERAAVVSSVRDLDRIGERRGALARAASWLERGPDEAVRIEADRIRGRLLAGPSVLLELDGRPERVAFGAEATIGRSEATVIVHSGAVSRQHVRLSRRNGEIWFEDLGTRNGTTLGGARLVAPLPIGAGVRIALAGQIDCELELLEPDQAAGPVRVTVGGVRTLLPLGPLHLAPWLLDVESDPDRSYLVLRTPDHAPPPVMGGLELGRVVELCVGDVLQRDHSGPVVLRVLGRGDEPEGSGP